MVTPVGAMSPACHAPRGCSSLNDMGVDIVDNGKERKKLLRWRKALMGRLRAEKRHSANRRETQVAPKIWVGAKVFCVKGEGPAGMVLQKMHRTLASLL